MLARGGRMSLLGLPDGPVTLDLNDQVIFKEARILGITGREMFRTWQQTTTLLSTGRVDVSPVITHRFPLERVRGGLRDRRARATPRRSSCSREGEGMADALDFLKERARTSSTGRGSLLHPRTLEGDAARARALRRARRHQPRVEQLPRSREPPADERGGGEGRRASSAPGRGAVRTIAGTMTMHRELERRFAEFKHAEDALMFQSGFTANAGTVAAILDKDDVIVTDRLNHASIIDGARLSRAEIKVFEHKDAEHADALLAETADPGRRQLLITDGVFSMDGDIAPLPDLVEVAEQHGAIMMVDDAHASGVLGTGGARHGRPLRAARARRHPGRHALEGDRRPRRVHRRAART